MSEEQEVKLKPIKHVTVTYESGWRYPVGLIILMMYLSGIVLAKGGWGVTFSIVIPPYALYLVVERVMQLMGVT
jgi:hypothetical protein